MKWFFLALAVIMNNNDNIINAFEIVSSSANHTRILAGDTITLFCKTDDYFEYCTWSHKVIENVGGRTFRRQTFVSCSLRPGTFVPKKFCPRYFHPWYFVLDIFIPLYFRPQYFHPRYFRPMQFRLRYFRPPVFSSPVFSPPVFSSPVFLSPVFSYPVISPPVFSSPVFLSPVFLSLVFFFLSFILLVHEGSHREVYQEFQPSYDTFHTA